MFRFHTTYFAWTVLLFATEVCIALFVHDSFIRPYFGDVLVVILIYCFVKSFLRVKVLPAALLVLLFAFFVEFLQSVSFIETLQLQHSKIARTVIGTSFSWSDIMAYIAGIAIVLAAEHCFANRS